MPTENKTTNLHLNSWVGTDKPKRTDFVADNEILDQVIGNHLENFTMHVSEEDRALFEQPFVIGVLGGNGNATCKHTLPINPSCIFVCLKNAPFVEYDSTNGYTICNGGFVTTSDGGGTAGIKMFLNTVTLSQSTIASSGRFLNLNKNGGQYFYIAFK